MLLLGLLSSWATRTLPTDERMALRHKTIVVLFAILWLSIASSHADVRSDMCYEPLCNFKTGFILDKLENPEGRLHLPMASSVLFKNTTCLKIRDSQSYCNLRPDDHLLIVDNAAQRYGRVEVNFWSESAIGDAQDSSTSDSNIDSDRRKRILETKIYTISSQESRQSGVSPYSNIASSFVELLSPSFGTIVSSRRFSMRFFAHDKSIPAVLCNIVGVAKFQVSSTLDLLSSPYDNPIEPASWFIELSAKVDTRNPNPTLSKKLEYRRSDDENGAATDILNGELGYNPSNSEILGPISDGYIEFVLDDEAIRQQRVFASNSSKPINYLDVDEIEADNSIKRIFKTSNIEVDRIDNISEQTPVDSRKHICIWASNVMDGQKIIWLNQISHFDEKEFKFSWILTLSDKEKHDSGHPITEKMVVHHLNKMNTEKQNRKVNLVLSPFTDIALKQEWLYEEPSDGGAPLLSADTQLASFNIDEMYRYISRRIRLAQHDIDALNPSWVKDLSNIAMKQYAELGCHIITYGNNRDSTADALITETARMAGIPTVTELLNLFADPLVTPDVIVAPSLYALKHPSLESLLETDVPITALTRSRSRSRSTDSASSNKINNKKLKEVSRKPKAFIISPGVDAEYLKREPEHMRAFRFMTFENCMDTNPNPNPRGSSGSEQNTRINGSSSSSNRCFVVAFMARVAPEKNPGLFVMAAHHFYKRNPNARFIVIGDGIIKRHVTDLARRMGLMEVMHFAGWISSNLRDYLGSIDVMVNPSLRGWSETFCIANVEAMSMSLPVVTFAVGGVGEYISGDIRSGFDFGDFAVSENAVIVNKASPQAISNALDLLYRDEVLRESIGSRARETVLKSFTIQQQIKKYTLLYNSLI